jgi:phosphate uptake regulator
VSLPSSWVKEVGLEPKSTVVMEVLPDLSLRVYVPAKQGKSVPGEHIITVDGSFTEDDIVREIIGGYVAGATVIKVLYKGLRREVIEKSVAVAKEKLMGLELIDEDAASITLQVVVDPNLGDLDSVVKRMVRLSASMHEDIISYLTGSADKAILEAVVARDNLVDKLYLLALRQLITILRDPYEMSRRGVKYYDSIYITMFLKSVERVADHAVHIANSLLLLETPPTFILEIYRGAINLFKNMCEAFINLNKDMAIESTRSIERLRVLDEDIRKRYREEIANKTALTRILDAIARIIARSLDIAEEVIDIQALRKVNVVAEGVEKNS